MKNFLLLLTVLFTLCLSAQTKVGGIITDEYGEPVSFANVLFKNSIEGTITNDNGRFYMESDTTYETLVISFIGYESQEISLTSKVTYNMEIKLAESTEQLNEVVIIAGKQSKKNNPAIDILRKIWAKKRENGIRKFKQYTYDKYEKIELDLNNLTDKFKNRKVFKR